MSPTALTEIEEVLVAASETERPTVVCVGLLRMTTVPLRQQRPIVAQWTHPVRTSQSNNTSAWSRGRMTETSSLTTNTPAEASW
jgi:hypothetical protein